MLNPVAKYQHAVVASEHEVEQYVSVAENEVFDLVVLDVLFGKVYKRLVLFATKVFLALAVVFLTARR